MIIELLMLILLLAVVCDMWVHKIPNVLLIILFISNVVLIPSGTLIPRVHEDVLYRMIILLTVVFLLFPFFAIGTLGAGDVKLIALATMSAHKPVLFLFMVFLLGGLLSFIHMIRKHELISRFRILRDYIQKTVMSRNISPYYSDEPCTKDRMNHSIHMSVPVLLAVIFLAVVEKGVL